MQFHFWKISAAGNDFIVSDYSEETYNLLQSQVPRLCDRHFGIGADGIIFIKPTPNFHFEMLYFNADGSGPVMCGNGARAAVFYYLSTNSVSEKELNFLAVDRVHKAKVVREKIWVTIKQPTLLKMYTHPQSPYYLVDTGVPHLILINSPLKEFRKLAPQLRKKYNANINLISTTRSKKWSIYTYERGVEGETLACGTGATAAAFILNQFYNQQWPINLFAQGGRLTIDFNNNTYWLTGPVELVFKGELKLAR